MVHAMGLQEERLRFMSSRKRERGGPWYGSAGREKEVRVV